MIYALCTWRRVGAASVTALTVASCAGDDRGGLDGPPPAISLGDAGPPIEPGPPPSCAGLRCSPDLRAVLDNCSGEVRTVCGNDSGCSEGTCVPACESAAKAQGSLGCEFYTTPPDTLPSGEQGCFAAFLANTWDTPATIGAELGGSPLDVAASLYKITVGASGPSYERISRIEPGEVGVLFLSQGTASATENYAAPCPGEVVPAHLGVVVSAHQTSRYPAFRIQSDRPISAYSAFPYGGASSFSPSATLLLPTSSWRANYILLDGWESSTSQPGFVQIVAQRDATEIRIRPRVALQEGIDVAGAPRGEVSSWTLDRGQVLEFVQPQSLAGSPLEASEPVAVFGGTRCANLPDPNVGACDTLHQQIAPVEQWGSRTAAVPYRSRRDAPAPGQPPLPEEIPYRISAAVGGTVLRYDPLRPIGAPAKLETGETATFTATAPFTVSSQDAAHPVYLGAFMTGGDRYATLGDPDFVNLIPDAQYLDQYVFYIDPSFQNTTLTLVRRAGERGLSDVEVDCLGVVTGWEPVGSDGTLEGTTVALTEAGRGVTTAAGSCAYGRHEARSDGAFGLYVWGIDRYASYGYAAGAGTRAVSALPDEVKVR